MSDKKAAKKQTSHTKKKKYSKPNIKTESLMTFGALCNGMQVGGRKSTTAGPESCNASKLLS